MIPYCRNRFSEEVAETHFLNPVFLPAEDSFKRGRERGIEIDAGRNLPIGRDIKVPKWVLRAYGYVDRREGGIFDNVQLSSICFCLLYNLFILILLLSQGISLLPLINRMGQYVCQDDLFNS